MSTIDGHRVHEKNEKEPKPKEMGGCCAAEVCVFFLFLTSPSQKASLH